MWEMGAVQIALTLTYDWKRVALGRGLPTIFSLLFASSKFR